MKFRVEKEIKLADQIFDVRYHPINKNLIAAATISGDVHLLESGAPKSTVKRHHKGSSIRRVRFNRDGHMVTIAKTVKVHDLESDQTTHMMKRADGGRTPFYSLKPFGSYMICAGDDDGKLMVWDTRTSTGEPLFTAADCDQYISDIDGQYDGRRLLVCTSGEGTLTAYDMRTRRMLEPQSELFEAGFQCLRMVDVNKKIVVGGEDCALYVFNQNEWAHTSGKFSVSNDARHRGKCSIDCLDLIDESVILAGCSDGRLRATSLWPHRLISETAYCKKSPLEAVHVHPATDSEQKFIVCGESYINIVGYSYEDDNEDNDDTDKKQSSKKNKTDKGDSKSSEDDSDDDSESETISDDDDDDDDDDGDDDDETDKDGAGKKKRRDNEDEEEDEDDEGDNKGQDRNKEEADDGDRKRLKVDKDDYLNVFK